MISTYGITVTVNGGPASVSSGSLAAFWRLSLGVDAVASCTAVGVDELDHAIRNR